MNSFRVNQKKEGEKIVSPLPLDGSGIACSRALAAGNLRLLEAGLLIHCHHLLSEFVGIGRKFRPVTYSEVLKEPRKNYANNITLNINVK